MAVFTTQNVFNYPSFFSVIAEMATFSSSAPILYKEGGYYINDMKLKLIYFKIHILKHWYLNQFYIVIFADWKRAHMFCRKGIVKCIHYTFGNFLFVPVKLYSVEYMRSNYSNNNKLILKYRKCFKVWHKNTSIKELTLFYSGTSCLRMTWIF